MGTVSTPTAQQILTALSPTATQPAYYGMVMLGMASQAYTTQGAAWATIQQSLFNTITQPQYTPLLPPPLALAGQGPVAGYWSLDWGPANGQDGNGDNSNLIYIASYRAKGNPNYTDGEPYFFVVSIRGTDISAGPIAVGQQVLQDIRDFTLKSWPGLMTGEYNTVLEGNLSVPTPNSVNVSSLSGNVAHGAMLGLVKIANSTAPLNNGQPPSNSGTAITPIAALNALLSYGSANALTTPIVVTGHSLGACQMQLMASYLAWQFPHNAVIPYGYAPPTAGDSGFIQTYTQQCPLGQFWYNTLDIVPYAYIMAGSEHGLIWANANLWTSFNWPVGETVPPPAPIPGPPLPSAFSDAIALLVPELPTTFRRPPNGVYPLAGNIPTTATIYKLLQGMGGSFASTDPTTGIAQLVWQHFPPCYEGLMLAQYGSQLAPFAFAAYPNPS